MNSFSVSNPAYEDQFLQSHSILQLSVNGYIGFATVLDQGPTLNVGPDMTDWPRHEDPAMIAPYLCKQQVRRNGKYEIQYRNRITLKKKIFFLKFSETEKKWKKVMFDK